MPKGRKATSQSVHPAQTPGGFVVTGLIMWAVAYLLMLLAIDSGSLIQWFGTLVAILWGGVRITEGVYKFFKSK